MNNVKRKNMKNKQYPPRGGPPLVYRCRGIPGFGTRVFPTAHSTIRLIRIGEDVGRSGWLLVPNLQGFGNPEGLKSRNKAREPAWLATKGESYYPGSIAVGFNQRKQDVHARTGLQPHFNMRLKPEELFCSSVNRQLKQTAMKEKQMPMKKNEIAMDSLYGSPNLQGFGNLEGLRFGLTSCSRAREPAGHPPEAVCRSGTGTERARDGTMVRNPVCPTGRRNDTVVHIRDDTAIPVRDGPDRENLHIPVSRPGIRDGMDKKVWRFGVQTLTGLKDAVRFNDVSTSAELNVYRLHNCDGTTKIVSSNPEGLHVYSQPVSRENTTPAGVERLSAPWYFYKHLMPACSVDRPPASSVDTIAVGFNQRIKDTRKEEGLQPHLVNMRLKPEELFCSIVPRQLKQTAMEEKQMPMKENEMAMDSLYGSPNLQGFGNLEGLRFGLTSCSRAREPAGHPPEAVCRSGTGTERARDGTMVRNPVVHSFAGIAVGFNQRTEKAHAGTGLQPHLFVMRLKPEELVCSSVTRQLKQTAMEEKQTAMAREAAGHPPEKVCRSGTGTERTGRRDGTMVHIRDDTGLHIRHGTDLGSRNAAASRPVHPPERERYGRRRRKCRMMNIEYSIMNEETGNVDPGSRKSEDGRQKSEPETGNIKFSCMRNEF